MSTRDLSRFLFQPRKHYAAARMQQGRTLLDSDQSEGADLAQEEWRRAVLDIVGPRGTPDEGFALGFVMGDLDGAVSVGSSLYSTSVSLNGDEKALLNLGLRPGTFYLGGMRLEMRLPELIFWQRDFLQATQDDMKGLVSEVHAFFYLEAWEQEVSAIEDEEVLEHALGGPDTTVRVRRFRRVHTMAGVRTGISCAEAFQEKMDLLETSENSTYNCRTAELESNGRLQLSFQSGSDNDPCTPDPPTQYLGTENQALRIMLTAADHYVWACDNAAPLYRATMGDLRNLSEVSGTPTLIRIQVTTPFKDEQHKPRVNQVVEVVPFAAVIENHLAGYVGTAPIGIAAAEIGRFAAVASPLDDQGGFTIDVSGRLAEFQAIVTRWDAGHPNAAQLNNEDGTDAGGIYIRFWQDRTADQPVEIPIGFYPGEPLGTTGIIPRLITPGRRGDYWIAALRPDTPTRIVPFDLLSAEKGVAPHGPHHFFAPIGLFQQTNGSVTEMIDCRRRMRKLIDGGCATFTVGDGRRNVGDYTVIQNAIDALPPEGGRIFILPGRYQQNIALKSRQDVVIEGCGSDTIIETPISAPAAELVTIRDSERISLSNLCLRAIEQHAIHAISSPALRLAGLSVISYVESAGERVPGAYTAEVPLVQLDDCTAASLRSVHLAPARRAGLLFQGDSKGTSVVDLSAIGVKRFNDGVVATNPPKTPMITLSASSKITLRDVSVQTCSQVGIALESLSGTPTEVTMSRLTILADAHSSQERIRTALDIEGTSVILEDSDITFTDAVSDEAAVVVLGERIILRGNRITTHPKCLVTDPNGGGCIDDTTQAWGGIQVRGGSHDVQILANEISGGLGHGITLGSVLWSVGSHGTPHREGAGKAQIAEDSAGLRFVTGSLSTFPSAEDPTIVFWPEDEGVIEDLVIVDNVIQGSSTNGISALTVLGLTTTSGTDLMEISNARIERNTITGNLRHPYGQVVANTDLLPFPASRHDVNDPQALHLSIPVLPFGGIVIATATGRLGISGNTIVQNGQSSTLPVNGVFVLNGDGIVIQSNRIAGNGVPALAAPGNNLLPGVRAGIAVMLAGTGDSRPVDLQSTLEVLDPLASEAHTLDAGGIALRIAGNSVQQPEGRALHAVVAGSVAIDANFLSSRGYHGAATTEDESIIGDVVFVQNLGTPWEAADADSIPEEGEDTAQQFSPDYTNNPVPSGAADYLRNETASPRLFTGAGGSLLFTNNQVIYDWDVKRPPEGSDTPLSFFAVVLMTLDHLGCLENQFAMRINRESVFGTLPLPLLASLPGEVTWGLKEALLGHVLTGGGTTQVARNRFAENVQACSFSAITAGEMLNITTFNQATHPILAYRWPRAEQVYGDSDLVEQEATYIGDPDSAPTAPSTSSRYLRDHQNMTLFRRAGLNYVSLRRQLLVQVRRFFDLLHEP